MSHPGRLEGKVAIVTGGGAGFGVGIVNKFTFEGAKVLIFDINEDDAKNTAALQPEGSALAMRGDVSMEADWKAALSLAVDTFGKLDIIVNNAGVVYNACSSIETTEADYDRVMRVNLKSLYWSSNVAIPHFLAEKKGGIFINISSMASVRPRPTLVWYGASKGGLTNATKGLAIEWAKHNIRFNVIHPVAGETSIIHGGGWTLGDLEGEDIACKAICEYTKVVVVSMDYRLAPENPFPRGLEDCWDILLWTLENSSTLGIDPNCVMVSGSSSGGNSTAVIAHRARDKGIALKGQILRIPATCHIGCYPPELKLRSMEELKDAPLLSKRSMETFYGYYSPPDPSSPEVSPLLSQNFKDLAPAYLQVAGMDPLRDEGLAYAAKLKDAGVPTKVDIYPGLPHAFGYFPELSATPKFSIDVITAIVQLIGGNL
ncbi:Versiconal hemiacetal acetate esterase [Colletotrichum sp. SAR 10_86]|nr:Versiconal hemiacetal acetate esterase [Colletotrichum sp. SAR 10_65]KAI8226366.1 Versiconal hemiacetal acetate esterase [Colletotrichum sp. SAR 10_86]